MLVCAVLAAVLVLYWPASYSLGALWSDTEAETYTSGFLIGAIALWLLWRARAAFTAPAPLTGAWRWPGLMFLGGCALAWQFSLRAGIQLGYLHLLPVLLWTCVLLVCGVRAARAAAFPIGFLIFALPVWDHFIPALQWLTIHVVRVALRATGIPSYFSVDLVQIPAGVFEIQGGCSGLHYLIVGLAVAALLGQLRRDSLRTRIRWLVVAGALSMLSNWVRVYTIILAGHLSHMQSYLVRVSHYSYGWLVFLGTLALFFLYVRFHAGEPRARAPAVNAPAVPDSAGPAAPAGWLVLVLAVAALPAVLNLIISARLPARSAQQLLVLPADTHGWHASAGADSKWRPVQHNADRDLQLRFTRGDRVVEMYAAAYVEQRQRRKLGGRANYPAGIGVDIIDAGTSTAAGKTFATQQVEHDGMRASLWRIYQVEDRWFTSPTRAQFWYSARTFTTLSSPLSRVWMLRTECAKDCAAAEQLLGSFVEENGETLWPESR
jgi:exosortase